MPKRNYSFEKRNKELARKRKKAEKLERKRERARGHTEEVADPLDPESLDMDDKPAE